MSVLDSEIAAKETLAQRLIVSRETILAFERYKILLEKWSAHINLVGPSTLPHFWHRHILDSAQILLHLDDTPLVLMDFGSGAGLPGLVLARLLADRTERQARVTLIEASNKRCGFLREAARALEVQVDIVCDKIEHVGAFACDVVTARAFAPLHLLLDHAQPWADQGARLFFLKGHDVQSEIEKASTKFAFQSKLHSSLTDARGYCLEIVAGSLQAKADQTGQRQTEG
jgi:16S rRNA (guanine527-N7)-methyltransferase